MSTRRCSLVWKAAALEDGRLDGADRASFEDHASRCADCRAEQEALVALAAKLDALPAAVLSPLAHARRRGALLERANERFVRPPRSSVGSRGVLLVMALVIVVSGVVLLAVRRSHTAPAMAIAEAPRFEVTEGAHAVWRARTDGTVTRVDLADGEATFRVDPHALPQRFVLSLPDGEVEVTGTRFTTDVALGRTRSVNVLEGHVVFRRRDEREMTLRAGEGWSRTEPVVELGRAPGPATPEPRSTATAALAPPSAMPAPRPRPAVTGRTATALPSVAAGEKFDEAIGSFVHGSYARADVELRAFIEEFPHDSRCEDAAFLSAVARWRMGDAAGARARAQSYLEAYPQGLRRAEAQRIADDAR